MQPELIEFFTNLVDDTAAFLTAYSRLEDRFQEAFDRDVDGQLPGLEFGGLGDIDHLTEAELNAAFTAFLAVKATMDANSRQNWSRLLAVVRSWNR